jgi:polyphenol oxidase
VDIPSDQLNFSDKKRQCKMIRKQEGAIEWLEFELLSDIHVLSHGVFLRHGGICTGPYKSLSVGRANEESDLDEVSENVSRIKNILNVDHLISGHQMHGKEIVLVDAACSQRPNCDALMTSHADLGLMIKHADCQAAIFYDPIHHALATVHCGWRGNVQNIYGAAVAAMERQFSSCPENILVGISPSLGPENAEFIHFQEELPQEFWPYQVKPTYFDLWRVARMQLEKAGILPHHIEVASICTYSNADDFFSFRRDKRVTGNHATVAVLRK